MADQAQEQSLVARFEKIITPEAPEPEKKQTPAVEAEEAPQPQENEPEAEQPAEEVSTPEEQAEPEEETAEPDLAVVEVDGQSYEVPIALKDNIMLQADYTRKTQEVATERKALEQEKESLAQNAKLHQENLAELTELMAVDKQIQQYSQLDWAGLMDADPVKFVELKEARRDLIDGRNNLVNSLQEKQKTQVAQQQQLRQKAIEEGQQVLAKDIPNWNPELANSLNSLAVDRYGFTPAEVAQVIDPRVVKLLNDAYKYHKQQSGQPITNKKVANLPKVSKPGSTVKQTASQQRFDEARKQLKKTGSNDAAEKVFQAMFS